MAKKVLIIDTSMLCVYFEVPKMDICGSDDDKWDYNRVNEKIELEVANNTTLVLPLATIIETGNHITQAKTGNKLTLAKKLTDIMRKSADAQTPWATFSVQPDMWNGEKLKELANNWESLVVQGTSLGDSTIKDVADYYSGDNWEVEILTGDKQLKSYEPLKPTTLEIPVPRRKKK